MPDTLVDPTNSTTFTDPLYSLYPITDGEDGGV